MENPLQGKHIVFLGSSVTYGSASGGVSFADFIAARNGCTVTKEAVSGTTLVDNGPDSYISRMKKLDKEIPVDLFVCQLSTNDASQGKPMGKIGDLPAADTKTVAGAIAYISGYAANTWGCPVAFYTNPRYRSLRYGRMVSLLHEISRERGFAVIDMWNDKSFGAITAQERMVYMADAIHPTREGYLQWWTPYMENALSGIIRAEGGKQ